MVRRGQNLRGPYGYVITQVYRKVPITINPAHRSRASQHPWLPERSTKLAVGASGGVLPPHSHYKQGQYSRFLRPVVAYGDGYSSPPIPGDVCIFIWRRIPSEIISQPEPGVVFEHSLLHSKWSIRILPNHQNAYLSLQLTGTREI
jgi:hypothetical protein